MNAKHMVGLVDVIEISDKDEIKKANERPEIDRKFTLRFPVLNGLLLSNLLEILSHHDERFPTLLPKQDESRAKQQNALWERLNAKALQFRSGPVQLASIAAWLKGAGDGRDIGILVQELIGRAFDPAYQADEESWAAAVLMDAAIRMKSPLKLFAWKISGRIRRARNVLAGKVGADRAAIHATGVAIHNLVVALHTMQALYRDVGARESLSPEEATHKSLSAPAAVLRQADAAGSVSGCPFRRGTLFIFKLSEAFKRSGDDDVVFQRGSWNQCPAEQWVPSLLAGVWTRATKDAAE